MADELTGGDEVLDGVVLIGDVVASREHADRAGLQRRLGAALEVANGAAAVTQGLHLILGDEFQGAVGTLADAVRLGLDIRLGLLPDVDLRIGIGLGRFSVFDRGASPVSQDGPAWWAARQAVEIAAASAARPTSRHVRSWAQHLDPAGQAAETAGAVPLAAVNSYLGLQDFVLSALRPRQLRLLAAVLQGETQREIARREGVTQSAVSQAMRSSGAQAVVHGLRTWAGDASALS